MRILVTGAAGCIGTNLCLALVKKGDGVIGVDNFINGDRQNLTPLLSFKKFKFFELDICKSFVLIDKSFGNISQIYHLACPTGVENLVKFSQEMLLTSALGTRNVLELAKKNKANLIFTSSSEVYGDPLVFPQSESYLGNVDPVGIRSPYEEGKRFAESLTVMYVRKYNLNAKIVRVFNTYGPRMSRSDKRVIPNFLQQALYNKPLTVHGKGEQNRTFCYIDDLIKGLILVMQKGQRGEVYNLGSRKQIKIKDLAELIIRITGSKSSIVRTVRPPHDHQSRLPSLVKIEKLGWHQVVDLNQGLLKTINYLKSL